MMMEEINRQHYNRRERERLKHLTKTTNTNGQGTTSESLTVLNEKINN